MARLNIETKLTADPRFQKLLIAVGNRHLARGLLWDLWELAQQFWFPNRLLIPESSWRDCELPEILVECGFAERREGGYYARGAEEHFGWLFERRDSGRKGGLAKAKAKAKKKAAVESSSAKEVLTKGQALGKPPSSLLPSPSSSLLTPSSNISFPSEREAATPPPRVANPVGFFIGRYVKAFEKRYPGGRPELNDGKIQGQIRRFVQSQPLERAVSLIEVYLQMDDPFFKTKTHDFITFINNLQKVGLALDVGRDVSKPKAFDITEIIAREKDALEVKREAV